METSRWLPYTAAQVMRPVGPIGWCGAISCSARSQSISGDPIGDPRSSQSWYAKASIFSWSAGGADLFVRHFDFLRRLSGHHFLLSEGTDAEGSVLVICRS